VRKERVMGDPVVHFEIIGKNPERLRDYFGELFGWQFDTSGPVPGEISEPAGYGFTEPGPDAARPGIPGGIGGGSGYDSHLLFYVGVADVEAALHKAEELGGTRRLGPVQAPSGLVIGQFTDPEGHLIGVAATGGIR
jgi:uncharacterized protein